MCTAKVNILTWVQERITDQGLSDSKELTFLEGEKQVKKKSKESSLFSILQRELMFPFHGLVLMTGEEESGLS